MAECAAKLGESVEAEAYLHRAIRIAPLTDSARQAIFNLGKIQFRRGNYDLAEQVFLEALRRATGNELEQCRAKYNLGLVYEAMRRWSVAIEMYRQAAAELAALGKHELAVAANQNQAWALFMSDKPDEAIEVLWSCHDQQFGHVKSLRLIRIQEALIAYSLYLRGGFNGAADLSRQLLEVPGPSYWASCLAAVIGGWISLKVGLVHDAENALLVAEHFEVPSIHETGNFDMAVLVNDLRVRLEAEKVGG